MRMGGERAKQRCERVEGDVMVAKRKVREGGERVERF